MAKAKMKTVPTRVSAKQYIESVEHEARRADALFLLKWFKKVTGMPARMWGPSIIGYGRYQYKYDTGREGEYMITGFAPRKANLVVYIMPGYLNLEEPLKRLGKHKIGKSCLYINKLADIDIDVLQEIVEHGMEYMRNNYETSNT